MASHEQIRELAYFIWQQEGCPEGKDLEHYFSAKQVLEAQEAGAQMPAAEVSPSEETMPQTEAATRRTVRSTRPRGRKSRE